MTRNQPDVTELPPFNRRPPGAARDGWTPAAAGAASRCGTRLLAPRGALRRLLGRLRRVEDVVVGHPLGQSLGPMLERLQLRAIAHVEGVSAAREDVGFDGGAGVAVLLEEPGDGAGRATVIVGHDEERRG